MALSRSGTTIYIVYNIVLLLRTALHLWIICLSWGAHFVPGCTPSVWLLRSRSHCSYRGWRLPMRHNSVALSAAVVLSSRLVVTDFGGYGMVATLSVLEGHWVVATHPCCCCCSLLLVLQVTLASARIALASFEGPPPCRYLCLLTLCLAPLYAYVSRVLSTSMDHLALCYRHDPASLVATK